MNLANDGHGFIKVDTEKLAEGIYQMHKEMAANTLALTIGMLDAKIMGVLDKQLRERVPDRFYFAGDPLVEHDGRAFREKIIHKVVVRVLKMAKEEGILQC
jgi:hypothetical protein